MMPIASSGEFPIQLDGKLQENMGNNILMWISHPGLAIGYANLTRARPLNKIEIDSLPYYAAFKPNQRANNRICEKNQIVGDLCKKAPTTATSDSSDCISFFSSNRSEFLKLALGLLLPALRLFEF